MKKDEVPMVKVKVLVPTVWKRERVEAGATLEVPESTLEQNPTIFERSDEPEPKAAKDQGATKDHPTSKK